MIKIHKAVFVSLLCTCFNAKQTHLLLFTNHHFGLYFPHPKPFLPFFYSFFSLSLSFFLSYSFLPINPLQW
ncbi:hypothetical protein CLU79DRAFT_515210 [Phycomyces nitens]|nr:hypothetical protein CLU79DRAFT_515210 [Phycomyces nitens]